MNQLAFSRAVCVCVCADMCVVWAASLFFYCWVIFPNDQGGVLYMEMGILPFFLASSCRYEEEGEELSPPPPPPLP